MISQESSAANVQLIPVERPLVPAFARPFDADHERLRCLVGQAIHGWLTRTPSEHTRRTYARDLAQFLHFQNIRDSQIEALVSIVPAQVSAWRDHLASKGAANATLRRKLTTLRSLFSYLQIYGFAGANPAHGKFVKAPPVPRDGKTVGLSPRDCRRLLDAPLSDTPTGIRDRAILAVLAYSACRVGELVRLRIGDFKTSGEHRVLSILGKGGKERVVPLHVEAVQRLNAWLAMAGNTEDRSRALFRPAWSARGQGWDGFRDGSLSTRSVQLLVAKYVCHFGLDPAVTVHSFRVTALTTARERGSDIIDLQDFAGHADPRTTLTYIRTRDRLSESPAYVLHYR